MNYTGILVTVTGSMPFTILASSVCLSLKYNNYLAFHQCGPSSIPGPGVISGPTLLMVLVFCSGFFLSVKNQHFQIPIQSWLCSPLAFCAKDRWHLQKVIYFLFYFIICDFLHQLVFEGIRGSSYTGDAAIDNVELRECGGGGGGGGGGGCGELLKPFLHMQINRRGKKSKDKNGHNMFPCMQWLIRNEYTGTTLK